MFIVYDIIYYIFYISYYNQNIMLVNRSVDKKRKKKYIYIYIYIYKRKYKNIKKWGET